MRIFVASFETKEKKSIRPKFIRSVGWLKKKKRLLLSERTIRALEMSVLVVARKGKPNRKLKGSRRDISEGSLRLSPCFQTRGVVTCAWNRRKL